MSDDEAIERYLIIQSITSCATEPWLVGAVGLTQGFTIESVRRTLKGKCYTDSGLVPSVLRSMLRNGRIRVVGKSLGSNVYRATPKWLGELVGEEWENDDE